MSTLDQAFIRAYQAGSARKAAAAATTSPAPSFAPAETKQLSPTGMPIDVAPKAAPRKFYVDDPHASNYVPHYLHGLVADLSEAETQSAEIERLTQRLSQVNATAAAPETTVHAASPAVDEMRAAYETQHFAWPRKLEVLIAAAGGEFAEFATELTERCRTDRKTLVVTGAERGSGRSLITLALARMASNRNLRTVIVDLDLRQPNLSDLLGLRPELGWDDACAERLPLTDVLVESLDDRLTLMPLRNGLANPRALAGNRFLADALDRLREHFDLVLLDAGPLHDDAATIELAAALGGYSLDDALVVRDRRCTTPQQIQEVGRRLAVLGVRHWDVAENFTEIQGY